MFQAGIFLCEFEQHDIVFLGKNTVKKAGV